MAKKKAKNKEPESYVASSLNITYTIPKGLVHLLAKVSKKEEREVWCALSDIANVCASRLSSKEETRRWSQSSWTQKKFPDTDITLRVDMDKYNYRSDSAATYSARFKVAGSTNESFTQAQVNDYIMENILLGDDDVFTEDTQN